MWKNSNKSLWTNSKNSKIRGVCFCTDVVAVTKQSYTGAFWLHATATLGFVTRGLVIQEAIKGNNEQTKFNIFT